MRHNRTLSARVERGRAHPRAGRGPATWAALAVLMAATVVAGGHAAGTGAAPRARLSTITATAGARGTSVLIESSEPVAYTTARPDPLTLLVDLRHATTAGAVNRLATTPVGGVAAVTLEDAMASDGAPVARVRLLLAGPASHAVRSDRNTIQVDVEPEGRLAQAPAPAPRKAAPASAPAAPAPAATQPAATRLDGITTSPAAPIEVLLKANGPLVASKSELTSGKPYRLVLDFAGVASGVAASTPVNKGPITRIRVAANSLKPLVTRVVFDLTAPVSYKLQPQGNDLKVVLGEVAAAEPAAAATEKAPAVARTAAPKKAPAAAKPAVAATASPAAVKPKAPARRSATRRAAATPIDAVPAVEKPAPEAPAPQAVKPAPAMPPPAPAPAVQAPPQMPAGMVGASLGQPAGSRQYSGHPISLDFQGADLRSVLRIFSVDTGLNIVIDPAVQGSVDVALRDVPWDQALDIILRANKLGWVADGTIIRVAPLTVLAEEEAQRRKLADEQALSGELKVITHTLSYAKAEDVKTLLNSALTKRGEVQIDGRTNTVIIRDLPNAIETARTLLGSLDRPQPQVEIEARIVQTTRDFARKIGVQWGFTGRVSPELGNTTGLAFPSSVVAGGGIAGNAVNLPVAGATSAVGIAMGAVNGAFNLDVALSALENSGKGRILSTPRVSTQNNVEAEVMQGTQIPIQTIANNTVTVQFKDAALTLKVTPQITASNTVIMNITLENASPDYSRQVGPNGIPPIDTQRAKTTVLVKDGDTTVIGGIYVSQEQAASDRTPGISRIPLLGWLFKREAVNDSSRELLIFITPRIAKL